MWYFWIIDYRNYNLKNPNHVITTFEILLSKNKDDRKRHSPKLVNRAFFSVYTPKKHGQRMMIPKIVFLLLSTILHTTLEVSKRHADKKSMRLQRNFATPVANTIRKVR